MEETAEYFNDIAVNLASEGLYQEAIACLKRGLQVDPYNNLIWFNLGLNYYALKKRTESCRALMQAARCNPFDADVWDTLGVVLHEIGDVEASRRAYRTAIDLDTSNGRIWNNYGTLLFNEHNYIEARRAFESALTLEPSSVDALSNLCDTYQRLGEYELVIKCKDMLNAEEGEKPAAHSDEAPAF